MITSGDSSAGSDLLDANAATTAVADALDPEKLSPLAEAAIRELLAEGESANTQRAYRGAMRYWEAWFACRYGSPMTLPVPVPTVIQFIVDHAARFTDDNKRLITEMPMEVEQRLIRSGFKKEPGPLSLSTLMLRMSVLSKLHQLKEVANPCLSIKVREAMSRTRRAYAKRGEKPKKKKALTLDPFNAILDTCDDSPAGVRDRALLMLAWASGGRRRSEVTQATVENVIKVVGRDRAYVFTLDQTKTDQAGTTDQEKPVVDDAADALEAWMSRSGIASGPIFRRVSASGKVSTPLAPSAVRDIVKRRAALAGLIAEGDDPNKFTAHSLRSGFVTEAARSGVPLGETMSMTGHTTVSSIVGYFRTEEVVNSKGARLLNKKPAHDPDLVD